MRYRLIPAVLLLATASGALPGADVQAQLPDPPIQTQLDTWFRKASRAAPGTWAIAIADQRGTLLWGVNPTRPMIPASTVKVFTTGFARTQLGGDARRPTRVLGVGRLDPATGTWLGTWALELNGDPTLERPARSGPTLLELASQLHARGVRRLTGPMIVQSMGGTPDATWPAAWETRHKGSKFAPLVGMLTLNENTLSFGVGPGAKPGQPARAVGSSPTGAWRLATIRAKTVTGRRNALRFQRLQGGRFLVTGTIGWKAKPRWFTGMATDTRSLLEASWAQALASAGIEWNEAASLSAPVASTSRQVIAEVTSATFDSVASEINRRSLNIGAELLLRWADATGQAAERLTDHVQRVAGDYLGVHLVDGSGLSHENRASPFTFVSYLAKIPTMPGGENFAMLFPANGQGTLRRLNSGLPGQGVVRAKTGTLGDAATLVGYMGRQEGVIIFSLMYNGPRVYAARQQQWRLFRMLGANGVVIPEDSVGEHLGGEDAGR